MLILEYCRHNLEKLMLLWQTRVKKLQGVRLYYAVLAFKIEILKSNDIKKK
ncbi:hypothetical protein FC99_GL001970 [Levilactobacillus koreensis JCM 16448]|nr:hypothetical protein FC99_GL001970 [Levilactobacillus koreensis JCM 16448]